MQVPHQSGGVIEVHAKYLTTPVPGSPLVYPVREVSPVHLESHTAHNALVVLTEGGHSFVSGPHSRSFVGESGPFFPYS